VRSTATSKAKAVNPVSEVVQTQLPVRRIRFDPTSVHSGFVVDKVSFRPVVIRVLRSSPASIIPPILHTHA